MDHEEIPNKPQRKNNNINISRPSSANVKKFKLNTFQIEADEDTRDLMSRTESLLQSSKSGNGSSNNSPMKSRETTTNKKSFKKSSNNTTTIRHEEQNKSSNNIVSDISAETFQSRTEALLHSKTKRKKKKHHR